MDTQNRYEDMEKAEKQWDEQVKKADEDAEKELDDAKFKSFMHSVYKDNFFNCWMFSSKMKGARLDEPKLINHSFTNREDIGGGTVQVSIKLSDVSPLAIYDAYAIAANSARLAIMDAIHKDQLDDINLKRTVSLESLKNQ